MSRKYEQEFDELRELRKINGNLKTKLTRQIVKLNQQAIIIRNYNLHLKKVINKLNYLIKHPYMQTALHQRNTSHETANRGRRKDEN